MLHEKILSYFLDPFAEGYTLEKTITLAIIALFSVYIIYEVLKKMRIRVDERFALGLAPFIIFGSSLRVWQDMGLVDSILFTTPNIYLLVFAVWFSVLFISWLLLRDKYYKLVFIVGLVVASYFLVHINFVNPLALAIDLALFSPFLLVLAKSKWPLENKIVAGLQIFDGTTTYTAIRFFGYAEQHFVPRALIAFFAPEIFIIAKIVVVVAVLLYLDRFVPDKNERSYVKALIATLALATSTRDLLRVAALV